MSASASDESFFISTAESALAGIAALVPVGSAPELSHKRTEPQLSCRACGTYLHGETGGRPDVRQSPLVEKLGNVPSVPSFPPTVMLSGTILFACKEDCGVEASLPAQFLLILTPIADLSCPSFQRYTQSNSKRGHVYFNQRFGISAIAMQ